MNIYDVQALKESRAQEFAQKFEEKLIQGEKNKENTNEKREHMKKCLHEAAKETIGYTKDKGARTPWVTKQMLTKMDERRKWKNFDKDGKIIHQNI